MRLKHRRLVVGETNLINKIGAAILLLLSLLNLLNQIHLNENMLTRIEYTVPYLIGAVMLYFLPWKYILSIILLLVGLYTMFNTLEPADLSSALFFCLSYACIRKYKYGVFLGILTIITVAIRSINMGDSIPQALTMVLGFYALYILFYFIIFKGSKESTSIKFKQLTKEENKILSYMADGLSQKEAGYELGYDKYQTNYIVKEIRKKTGYDSLYEILYRAGLKDHSTSGHNK